MKKRLFAIFSFLSLAAIFFIPAAADALSLNVNYPEIGGINLNEPGNQNIVGLVQWLYFLMIGIAGIAAFIMLVWAGVQWILAAANPAMISDAKDRAYKALLGLALVFGSYLLVQLLNPTVLNPELGGLDVQDTPRVERIVFVSSESFSTGNDGDFPNGLQSMDAACAQLADDAGIGGIGIWRAWATVGGLDALDRFIVTSNTLYRLPNEGAVIADGLGELVSGTLRHPINRTEGEGTVPSAPVWTGTTADGESGAPADCGAWNGTGASRYLGWIPIIGATDTAIVGNTGSVGAGWTEDDEINCSGNEARLYCFQQ